MSGLNKESLVGVIGAGTMGAGIAQLDAVQGNRVCICDSSQKALVTKRKTTSRPC